MGKAEERLKLQQKSRIQKKKNLLPVADSPLLSTGYVSVAWHNRLGFKEMLALDRVEHPLLP